jgi:nitrate reductase assembly molybdenum cofactor insertion protein NarJ
VGLSRQISVKAPHLSLDLIGAFLEHFQSYPPHQKEFGLLYIQPWLAQMETQLRSGSADYAETLKEIKSILKAFIRMTYEKPQVSLFSSILIM